MVSCSLCERMVERLRAIQGSLYTTLDHQHHYIFIVGRRAASCGIQVSCFFCQDCAENREACCTCLRVSWDKTLGTLKRKMPEETFCMEDQSKRQHLVLI
jgi:hypothetical protein